MFARDVLKGFRDIENCSVDLDAWFADRDVQEYIEKIERKGAFGIAKAGFSFLSGLSSEKINKGYLNNPSLIDDSNPSVAVITEGFPEEGNDLEEDETSK